MKTIVFYSFKGGTGRSLGLANLASALLRIGESVAVLDFDFEAPGLQHKLASILGGRRVEGAAGAVDYILATALKRKGAKPEQLKKFNLRDAPLTDYMTTVSMPHFENKDVALHFLHAGAIESDDYWHHVVHPVFQECVNLNTDEDEAFFEKLATRVSKLNPQPAYLLVDSRSGVNELSGICTRLLAHEQMVVLYTCYNEEGLRGSRKIVESFERARKAAPADPKRKVYAPRECVLVLSRVPTYYEKRDEKGTTLSYYEEKDIRQCGWEAVQRVFASKGNRIMTPITLVSEPTLLMMERLLIPAHPREKVERYPLAKEYLEFFGRLLPEHEREFNALIPPVEELRAFFVVPEEGRLINPEDGSWNIAYRRSTILKPLEGIWEEAYKRAKGPDVSEEDARDSANSKLYEDGWKSAEDFAVFVARDLRESDSGELSTSDTIRKWCQFDSRVGFGRFEPTFLGEGRRGSISVTWNYLAEGRDPKEPELCSYLTGYMARVLDAIFGEPVRVTHSKDNCAQHNDSDPPKCIFEFHVASLPEEESKT